MKGRSEPTSGDGRFAAAALYLGIYGGFLAAALGYVRRDPTLLRGGTIVSLVGLLTLFGALVYALGRSAPQLERRWPATVLLAQILVALAAGGHAFGQRDALSTSVTLALMLLVGVAAGAVSHDEPFWTAADSDADAGDGGGGGPPRTPPPLVSWSAELWRGQTRAAPVLLLGGTLAAALLGAGWVLHTLLDTQAAAAPLLTVGFVAVAATLALTASIVQTNRPQRLVSPHLRHEPGRRQELAGPRG